MTVVAVTVVVGGWEDAPRHAAPRRGLAAVGGSQGVGGGDWGWGGRGVGRGGTAGEREPGRGGTPPRGSDPRGCCTAPAGCPPPPPPRRPSRQWRHQAPCAELGEARGGAERTTASPTTSFLRPLVSNTPPPVSFL